MHDEKELRSFMRDIENPAVDKKDWIKRGDVKELIEQHRKRNEGNITIAEKLLVMGYLDPQHKDYGLDYFELQHTLTGPLQIKTSAYMFKMGDSSLKRSNAERVYRLVSKAIGKEAESALHKALNAPADNTLRFEFVANVYRGAFEVLEKEIDRALKIISEEGEKLLHNNSNPVKISGEYRGEVSLKSGQPVSSN